MHGLQRGGRLARAARGGAAGPSCGALGRMRPNVVWFGEVPLHLDTIAAGFVDMARQAGIATMELDLKRSARAGVFDWVILGTATKTARDWLDTVIHGGV